MNRKQTEDQANETKRKGKEDTARVAVYKSRKHKDKADTQDDNSGAVLGDINDKQ